MPRLSLNFATKQRPLQEWNPLLGSALLVAGLIALGLAFYDYEQQLSMNSDLQEQSANLQDKSKRQGNNATIPSFVVDEITQANQAYALLQTPWDKIFKALERTRSAHPNDIALLAVKADTGKRELSISGEAKDFAALSAFNTALSANPIFQNITLSNDKLNTGNFPIVISFDLRLNWIQQSAPENVSAH